MHEESLPQPIEESISLWFKRNDKLEGVVENIPLGSVSFDDQYQSSHIKYSMDQMVRVHLLREILQFDNETALRNYIGRNKSIAIGLHFFEDIPDQSTLWRTWKVRFDDETRAFIQELAEYIIEQALEHDVPVPDEVFESIERKCENE